MTASSPVERALSVHRFQNRFCEQPETPYSYRQPRGLQSTRPLVFVATAISHDTSRPVDRSKRRVKHHFASCKPRTLSVCAGCLSLTSCCIPSGARCKGDFLAEDGLCAIGTLSFQSSIRTSWRFRGDRNLEYRGERKLFCNRSATPRWQIEGRSDPTRRSNSSPPLRSRYTRHRHRLHAPPEKSTCVSFCESA